MIHEAVPGETRNKTTTSHGIDPCMIVAALAVRFGYKTVTRASEEQIRSMLLELAADLMLSKSKKRRAPP